MKKKLLIVIGVIMFISLVVFRNEILIKILPQKEASIDYYSYCWGPYEYCSKWKPDTCNGRSIKKLNQIPDGPDMTCYGELIKQ